MTKVRNVIKYFDFYIQRPQREGGVPFAYISATQLSIFIMFSLLEKVNIALRHRCFFGLYKKCFGRKTARNKGVNFKTLNILTCILRGGGVHLANILVTECSIIFIFISFKRGKSTHEGIYISFWFVCFLYW